MAGCAPGRDGSECSLAGCGSACPCEASLPASPTLAVRCLLAPADIASVRLEGNTSSGAPATSSNAAHDRHSLRPESQANSQVHCLHDSWLTGSVKVLTWSQGPAVRISLHMNLLARSTSAAPASSWKCLAASCTLESVHSSAGHIMQARDVQRHACWRKSAHSAA